MVTAATALELFLSQVDVNRVPTGSGIDFLVWPIMAAAFAYIVYAATRKKPSDKGNKDQEK
jgi:hypothetical protein